MQRYTFEPKHEDSAISQYDSYSCTELLNECKKGLEKTIEIVRNRNLLLTLRQNQFAIPGLISRYGNNPVFVKAILQNKDIIYKAGQEEYAKKIHPLLLKTAFDNDDERLYTRGALFGFFLEKKLPQWPGNQVALCLDRISGGRVAAVSKRCYQKAREPADAIAPPGGLYVANNR